MAAEGAAVALPPPKIHKRSSRAELGADALLRERKAAVAAEGAVAALPPPHIHQRSTHRAWTHARTHYVDARTHYVDARTHYVDALGVQSTRLQCPSCMTTR